jgi:hypothetical protein
LSHATQAVLAIIGSARFINATTTPSAMRSKRRQEMRTSSANMRLREPRTILDRPRSRRPQLSWAASVTLTDAMGMVPSLTLSQFPQIVEGARISKSGNAIAQSGDLQTLSASTAAAQTEPVQLIIDERID